MKPPWIVYPGIPWDSLSWQIGKWAEYQRDFIYWFRALPSEAQALYQNRYPETDSWVGYLELLVRLDKKTAFLSSANDNDYDVFLLAQELSESGRFAEASDLFLWMAQNNYEPAQSRLAGLLADWITPPQPGKAVYWMKRAIRNGSETERYNLAIHHRNRNNRQGYLFWLECAALNGDEEALEEWNLASAEITNPTA
ncbi:sel1 repeat family protein [Asticcacaulis excentricus]|uniref:sel1 repeat family protein n=1 Tax=Asticcacaulis excentricus TaxID=78587 RepID=UPI000F84AC1E|nr:sel1 repeat family protein [Asticcacaulis excentricus]